MKRHLRAAGASLVLIGTAAAAAAGDHQPWYERVDLGGDVRLRYEGFSQDDAFDDGRRDRFRIRLRVGLEAAVTDALTVGFQLRSGDPDDPVSNNTSLDGGFKAKDLNLAQGYVDARLGERFAVVGGKFEAGTRWTVSDLQWDDDVTIEGAMETFSSGPGDGAWRGLEVVAYQLLLEESGSGDDAYLLGSQLRADLAPAGRHRIGLGAGFDYWDNPQAVADLTLDGSLAGNRVTNLVDAGGLLLSDFEILNLFAVYRFDRSKRWPVKIKLFYYRNLGSAGEAADDDSGYFARLQVGDCTSIGQVAFRYSRYYSDPDALFYVFTQSDTGRGSNVDAHRFDVWIGFVASSHFKLTWYRTEPASFEDETLDRWQVDLVVRF